MKLQNIDELIMINYKIITTILLGFVVAASCSDAELRASDYIDVTFVDKYNVDYLKKFGNLIDEYNHLKNLKETLAMLDDLRDQLVDQENGMRGGFIKFNSAADLDQTGSGIIKNYIDNILNLIGGKESSLFFLRISMDQLFNLIKISFNDDLNAFAEGNPTHHKNLCVFLRQYAMEVLSVWIEEIDFAKMSDEEKGNQRILEKMLAYDLRPDYTEAELISKIRKMDLTKSRFDTKAMLKSYQPDCQQTEAPSADVLFKVLDEICDYYSGNVSLWYQIHTWARLLLPAEQFEKHTVKGYYLKRLELMRFCSPLTNKEKHESVIKNMRRARNNHMYWCKIF